MAYLKAQRRDTEVFNITLADSAGDPLDLSTLDEIWFTVRYGYGGALIVQKTMTGGGIAIVDANAGTATITLDPVDTDDLPDYALDCPYDVQIKVTAGGVIATPIRGRIRFAPDVTSEIA